MAGVGAPPGSRNAAKSRMFEQALVREIKQRDLKDGDGETLRKIVSAWLDAAPGDLMAARELRDTLDGKPTQRSEISGPDGAPLFEKAVLELVKPSES